MEFEAILLEHMGKDIYIGVENSEEQWRRAAAFEHYQLLSLPGSAYDGSGAGFLCSGNNHREGIKLEMKAKIQHLNRLFDIIDIEARYQRYFYHIYIMNCMDVQGNCQFAHQMGGRLPQERQNILEKFS